VRLPRARRHRGNGAGASRGGVRHAEKHQRCLDAER
jgi:hypothetical protein